MERGVVVGGLMICGSFLLAASLNRSAVKETPPAVPAAAAAEAITPPPKPASCAADANNPDEPVKEIEPKQGDLPGNGREACSR